MKTQANVFRLSLLCAVSAALVACGGGDGGTTSFTSSSKPAAVPAASSPKVATQPSGASPAVTAANCGVLMAATVAAPAITGADMQATSDILQALDPAHGYSEFARLPGTFMWWLRGDANVDMLSLGAAVHETNHKIDSTLRNVCNTDGLARYFANGVVHVTDISRNDKLANYSIAGETYPANLKSARALRYDAYVTTAASSSGNDLSILLDELNAYTGTAHLEVTMFANPAYAYLASKADADVGGMVDFMLFLQSYLKAARLNHPTTYSMIQAQSLTRTFIQFAWSRAEGVLAAAYPYSTVASSNNAVKDSGDVIKAIYSAEFLQELDLLGITHKVPQDWAATYLK